MSACRTAFLSQDVNKWDLVEKETNTMRDMEAQVRQDLSFMPYAPVVFLSALTGQRVDKAVSPALS